MCENCIHCIDKKIWTCELEEPCINGSLFESEEQKESEEIALKIGNSWQKL